MPDIVPEKNTNVACSAQVSDLAASIDRQVSSILLCLTPRLAFGSEHQVQLFYQWLTSQPESAIGMTTDISAIRIGRGRVNKGDPGTARLTVYVSIDIQTTEGPYRIYAARALLLWDQGLDYRRPLIRYFKDLRSGPGRSGVQAAIYWAYIVQRR